MTTNTDLELRISGMDCADCALKLEKGVSQLEGIDHCQVNFAAAKMKVAGDVDPETVAERVRALGYSVSDNNTPYSTTTTGRRLLALLRKPRNVLTLLGALFIAAGFGWQWLAGSEVLWPFLVGGLFGLYFPARSGWGAIRSGQGLDMNVLMTIAAVGAFAIGEYGEGATVIVLFSLGEALEGYTMDRARDSIRSLTQLAPAEATVLQPCLDCAGHLGQPLPDGSGVYQSGPCPWCEPHEQTIPVGELAVGDKIIIKPDERIPMDGRVLSGRSSVNQAPITGESVPVEKTPGSELFAGTINGSGLLEVEVTHLAKDNTLSRLIYLVEEAQAQKTPAQRFVDKFARVYTPAVVVVALLVAIGPPLLFGQPFFETPDTHGWLYRALALLVIACPCALVIATPVSVVSAIAAAARQGVLIKGGAYLETLGRVNVIAFDKTGTLTQGQPQLVTIGCADTCCAAKRQDNGDDGQVDCNHCDEMLAAAAALERYSSHPLAQAVTSAAQARHLPQLAASNIENLPGQGIRGEVGQQQITIGSHTMLHNRCPEDAKMCQRVAEAEANGQTAMLVGDEAALRGYMAVSDPPRHSSQHTVQQLKALGIQKTVMLTGDNPTVAGAIGRRLAIDDIRAGLMPADKVEVVRQLTAQPGTVVAMVGDGVNDAPALAAADVGIAMGASGTAQALETADVALMGDDLTKLPSAIDLGRRAVGVIKFNIWFAIIIKAIFLVTAILGVATLWMAVFADMGASLIVTLNGMRLLKQKNLSGKIPQYR